MMYSPDGKHDNNGSLEDLLAAHADALITGQPFDTPALQDGAETYALLHLASRLRETLVPVDPSADFLDRLKLELIGEPSIDLAIESPTLLRRWQRLPIGYRVAAGVGAAGLALLAVGRVLEAVGRLQRRVHPKTDGSLALRTTSVS